MATSLLVLTVVVRGPVSVDALPGFAVLWFSCVLPVDNMCFTLILCETQVKTFLCIIFTYTETHMNNGVTPMASANKNAKSQLFTVRVPHEVVSDMELLKRNGESSAGFIVSAMQGEIIRRQLKESGEEKLLSSLSGALEALERIGEIGTQAGAQLRELVDIAQHEAQQLKTKSEPKG